MDNIGSTGEFHSDDLEAAINASEEYGIAIIQNIISTIDKHSKIKIIGIATMRYVHIDNFLWKRGGELSDAGLV